ncbi:glycosyltransferase family 4 protein [Acidiferrimicrobium sp. IK]|uniref:glycosyltransferase family 4 protein n=1 Tax=Acidiferrimicrobium sp. IK TaxID=2871700 RepID=UPI0021CAF6E5|nr:glycosyltransferase family 4 protein [Acidiferrimicrobium sp. IK]MCU4185554.1 glycosyltransferase family 4 protein [Acidiferrimicrobium sp. IK]
MVGRLAIVPPRFGDTVVGGSEAVSRETALGLASRGWDVEVLTTTALDHYAWGNDLPEGEEEVGGLRVRRFRMVHHGGRAGEAIQRRLTAGIMPSLDEQITWLSWRFQVPGLYHHLLRYADSYDAVVFSPYLFWTTTVCMPAVAEKAVVVPCLHDEVYARLDVIRPVVADAASVWFLSEPEHLLAHRLGPVAPRHTVTGSGVAVPQGYDPDGFVARHRLRRPFLLYAGRRERDKGWDALVDMFAVAVREVGVDMDLVTFGVGEVDPPASIADRVIDLGFLPDEERDSAFAAATAYAQPSRMESFSRTVMEAWLAGSPVLSVAGSEVVNWHIERSGGGLTYSDGFELGEALHWVAANPNGRAEMAAAGRRYVLDNCTWPVVLDRMEADLRAWT